MNPNSPKAKRIAAAAATTGAKAAATKAMTSDRAYANKPQSKTATASKPKASSPKAQASTPKKSVDLSGFGAAFKKARAQGVGTKFAYNDKMYSAVTRDDISRAGKSSLKEFLESSKRKATTKLAKAPGQREEALIARRAEGGTITPSRQQRLREMMRDKRKKRMEDAKERNQMMLASARGAVESMNTPGMRSDRIRQQMKDRSEEARKRNIELKNRSGAAVSEGEMQSFMEQMNKPRSMDRFKSGGSVMARGCKMGRKKATKIY
jgi:hypothetical protein